MCQVNGWSVAVPTGKRGAGLGNEILAWAKAWIAADLLDQRLVEQPWDCNRRLYGFRLGHNVDDLARQLMALYGSHTNITWDMIRGTGQWDYREGLIALRDQGQLGSVNRHVSRMQGGFFSVYSAREATRVRLIANQRVELAQADLRIGVHVRLGDFSSPQEAAPGLWNTRQPLNWYQSCIETLIKDASGQITFCLVSDDQSSPEFEEMVTHLSQLGTVEVGTTNFLYDLALLASCDVLVPSVSWFSMLALFVSEAAFVWPRSGLNEHHGLLSIWGHEVDQVPGPTADAIAWAQSHEISPITRGIPFPSDEGRIREWLQAVQSKQLPTQIQSDLLYYGVTPQ